MTIITLIGIAAAILTTSSGIPQVLKVIKTKRTCDLSLVTILMIVSGVILWFTYGILIQDIPLIFANGIGLTIQGTLLFLKVKHN